MPFFALFFAIYLSSSASFFLPRVLFFLATTCITTAATHPLPFIPSADRCGGANGSIRFEPEINHGANAGLVNALQLLQPIKDKHPEVGWADLIQLASAAAIEQAGKTTEPGGQDTRGKLGTALLSLWQFGVCGMYVHHGETTDRLRSG